MKKLSYIIPIVTALIGLFLGYLIFSSKTGNEDNHVHTETENSNTQIWTCSMHPQIRQNEPGSCPICGMDLIPLAAASSSNSNPYIFEMTEDAVKLANIQTIIVGDANNTFSGSLKLNGKIQVNETEAASLVAHLPGRIERLFVSFTGEEINKGDRIATIYSPELVAAQRELLEAKKLITISPEILQAAKNKLKYWKVDDKFIDKVLDTETIIENFTIYSDQSGVVMLKKVTVGDYVKLGDVLFNLQNLDKLWVQFDVYESDLSKISLGAEIEFSTPSISNKTFNAKIAFIEPTINAATRVAIVRAEVNNSSKLLKPEMFVSGLIKSTQTTKSASSITIPKSAVLYTGERSVVYLKIPNTNIPSYEFKEISLGEAKGDSYEVKKGLENGDEVVVYGAFVIDAAAQLNNQASMMNRNIKVSSVVENSLPDYTKDTPSEFKTQLEDLTLAYLNIKDALVASNSSLTAKQAGQFSIKLKAVDMLLLKGNAHTFWMGLQELMNSHIVEISSLNDLEKQRSQFDFLSQALITSLKVYGVEEGAYYIQHCPMANKNNGADWISKELSIKNPYFGDAMLSCGQTQDTIDENY
ncbi:MAG: efflux RND transporter periplasmic adaptor subunit [Chitinophagales bacterium]|nr:efflux RND transporter periplasmic adaptor subunit [Chitinophagales bacterium]